uniref:Uncharacterized protein n=1 Tax=Nelumbo nucifera TaxID=4432 RepID=A0A822XKX0_NELNU|nr:TPA_asm: hypothetical protein HUJ06_022115 [Nelumbo nucifera]
MEISPDFRGKSAKAQKMISGLYLWVVATITPGNQWNALPTDAFIHGNVSYQNPPTVKRNFSENVAIQRSLLQETDVQRSKGPGPTFPRANSGDNVYHEIFKHEASCLAFVNWHTEILAREELPFKANSGSNQIELSY